MRALLIVSALVASSSLFAQTSWIQATPAAQWSGRRAMCVVEFNGKMWLLGGWQTNAPTYCSDVWSSSDGVTWTLEQANAWPGRAQFAAAVYDNKIWVTGGWDGTRRNDVWYSSDGISWTQAAVPAWAGRNGHYNMVHDSKLWVVAGLTATSGRVNDAWWTTDGVTWTSATLAAAFPGQSHGAGTAFDNKLWISGGLTNNNAVWSSIDGTTWTAATLSAQWGARSAHAMAAYNNRLWVMGGSIGDCWASIDGVTWTSEPVPTGWGVRQYPATVVYDNKLWLFGGQVGSTNLNDVWSYSESTPPQVTSTAPSLRPADSNDRSDRRKGLRDEPVRRPDARARSRNAAAGSDRSCGKPRPVEGYGQGEPKACDVIAVGKRR
jgi:hypothetical protein